MSRNRSTDERLGQWSAFTYVARNNKTGEKIKANIDASDEAAAAKLLTDRGLSPLEITVLREDPGVFSNFKSRVPTKERVIFSRQLSTLINAGLPLSQSLNTS